MGAQGIVTTSILLFQTPSAGSKTKDSERSSISFKDVLKRTSWDFKDASKKDEVSHKKVLAGSYRAAFASSQRQVRKNEVNYQQDKPFANNLSKNGDLESEDKIQSQVLSIQLLEIIQLIFNLLQSGENLSKLKTEQVFHDGNVQEADFSAMQYKLAQTGINLGQYLDLNGELNHGMTVAELLQSIVQTMQQKSQNQQALNWNFAQENVLNTENIFNLLEELVFGEEVQKPLSAVKSDENPVLQTLKNLFAQEGESFNVLLESKDGVQFLKQVLKELENIVKEANDQKIVNSFNTGNSDRLDIGEKRTSNFSGIGSNGNEFNKTFSSLLSKENMSVNNKKGESKAEGLDLRQYTFLVQNKIENFKNAGSFQDDKQIKALRMSIVNQLAEKISMIHKQNMTTLQVSIKPEWLGSVVIEISKDSSGKIFGNLIVTTPQVKEIIEGSLSNLLTILKDQGINISQLNVSLGGSNTGQQYQGQQRFSQRENLFVQSNDDGSRNIESLIYEMSESVLNLRA